MAAPMDEKEVISTGNSSVHNDKEKNSKYKEIMFFTGLTGVSLIGGFSLALGRTKKEDPDMFVKGISKGRQNVSGSSLGVRALALATLFSVSGVGLVFFVAYKVSGASNLKDFFSKVEKGTPKLPKKESTGRNEFGSIQELVDYIVQGGKG
ncbi:uncharacterized protein LOC127724749 [Mytilus californianus]|uniref:uncharacterized protein LOC127724749 n=1 Tax=Mytilus californianus TaxID=6549 RepID=UPI0022482995|nr:uncharacterized protein LOC127724749 [Mytilus californianus]